MGTTVQKKEREQAVSSVNKSTSNRTAQTQTSKKPNSVYDVKQPKTSKTTSVEGYSIEKTQTSSKKKSHYSEGELLTCLTSILGKLKFKNKEYILERTAGISMKELAKKDLNYIYKVFAAIRAALQDFKGKKFTNFDLAKRANEYFVATVYNQYSSIQAYRENKKNNDESLSARLDRAGCKDIEEYMESQFGKNRSFLGNMKDRIKANLQGKSLEEFKLKQQIQDFSKLLVNSSKDDKFRMVDAIKHMYQNDNIDKNFRVKALELIYMNLAAQEQIEFSERFVDDKEVLRIVGADASKITIQGVDHIVSSKMSQNQAVRHNENINISVTKIENRIKVLKAKKNLTDAEKTELKDLQDKLNNKYTPMQAGNTTGTLANYNIEDQTVVDNILANNTSHSNREEVMKDVAGYMVNHADEMRYSQEECTAILDKVTNGDYSIIEAQVREEMSINQENNTNDNTFNPTEYSDISVEKESQIVEETANIYTQNTNEVKVYNENKDNQTILVNYVNVNENENNSILQTENKYETVTNPFAVENTNDKVSQNNATDEKTKRNSQSGSLIKTIKEDIKNNQKGSWEWQKAIQEYKSGSSALQVAVLASCHDAASFNTLVDYTDKKSSIEKFFAAGLKGPDKTATDKMREKYQELCKKENHKAA